MAGATACACSGSLPSMIHLRTILDILVSGVALSGLLPLAPHLERLPLVVVITAFLSGFYADRKSAWLDGRIATLLAAAGTAWYLLQANRQNLATPMVS